MKLVFTVSKKHTSSGNSEFKVNMRAGTLKLYNERKSNRRLLYGITRCDNTLMTSSNLLEPQIRRGSLAD